MKGDLIITWKMTAEVSFEGYDGLTPEQTIIAIHEMKGLIQEIKQDDKFKHRKGKLELVKTGPYYHICAEQNVSAADRKNSIDPNLPLHEALESIAES